MNPLHGLCAFPITPADAHGTVQLDELNKLVLHAREAGVDSICVLGSTGTYAYLSRAERRRTIESAVNQAGGIPVLACIGALRTDEVLKLGHDAQDTGATAVLLAPVSYTPLTEHDVFSLFESVSAELRIPVCVYNNPGTTHFTFSPALLARLSRLPHIAGAKSPAPPVAEIRPHLSTLRTRVAAGFSLGYSGDWNATEALIAGADAWYSVAAGLFPQACVPIVRAARTGDNKLARALDARLQPLWKLFRELSSLRVMYAAAASIGIKGAVAPLPIQPLGSSDQDRVRAALDELQLV